MQLTIFLLLLASVFSKEELLFVSTILRHGARNMLFGHHELINEIGFTDNPGKLTKVGRHQLYLAGKQLAQYYIKEKEFMPPTYDSNSIIIRASGLNRTIESVQSLMLGMYPPGTGLSLSLAQEKRAVPPIAVEDLDNILNELGGAALPEYMQAFPIHTTNEKKDYLLSPNTACVSINNENQVNKDEFKKIDKEYGGLYGKIGQYGIKVNSIEDVFNLYNDMTTVEGNAVQKKINFKQEVIDEIKALVEKHGRMIMLYSERKRKLLSHAVLNWTIKYFEEIQKMAQEGKLTQNHLKMAIFHLSDNHILAISLIFNLMTEYKNERKKIPVDIPFASFLRFELYRNTENKAFKVHVIYNDNNTFFEDKKLEDLTDFIKFVKKHIYASDKEFYDSCLLNINKEDTKGIYIALIIALVTALFIIASVFFIMRCSRRNKTTEDEDEFYEGKSDTPGLKERQNTDASLEGINVSEPPHK